MLRKRSVSVFDLFEFSRAFCVFGFSELSSKEIKTNAAADSALFQRLPENRFRDVLKKFPINYTISASEIVVLGYALDILRREIQKGPKHWRPDLFLK